ncbi:MAG: bifunctional 4-hydroxy-2-oxoglutarate aldolase/2-dehydro-3-deoxy-phosphogluconate aldolase [Solobacterium sp.]|nr:bifunctional 4-hydroxy-2-oxoglutarate aldolase/2-dehydro-3-deoxy-phosphogluconate aldolase [Solobacterium sp.]
MKTAEEVKNRLYEIGIIPAIVLNNVKDAAPLAEALCKGGMPAAEVTFRTECAHDAMIAMKQARPDLLVGAGTVLTKEQVDSAIDAGAEFIVSPGLNPEVVKYALSKNVAVVPGVGCASDIEKALEFGLDVVKFFPAEPLGGLKTIKALTGPYTTMRFMPTGGVNEKNMNDYLKDPKIFAVGGTWMVKADLIEAGEFTVIEQLCRKAMLGQLEIKIKHIGVNVEKDDAKNTADKFAALFQGTVRETSKGYFASDFVEIMAGGGPGTHGHIAMGVNNVPRALAFFKGQGFEIDESTVQYDEKGLPKFAYFKDEIGGFKVHVTRN